MNAKNIILSLAVFLFVTITAFSLMPEDLWDNDLSNVNHAQTPQVSINGQQNRLARNNTLPPINQMVQRQIAQSNSINNAAVNNAVNSGINFNALMQPVATTNTMGNVVTNNQFSFANKQNGGFNNNAVNNVVFNNMAATNPSNSASLAMQNGVVKNGVLQQAPQIFSDAFPPATHDDGRNVQNCSLCHQVLRKDMAGVERITNNNNLSNSLALNYSGMIQKISNLHSINGWNREHIWVRSQSGDTVEIVTAPNWFLDFVGCTLSNNMLVKGTAFQYQQGVNRPRVGQSTVLYAKNIISDGQLCRLRSDTGLPLWSD